jgi:MFS transporter, FSR family, fosmidomycin resistance protein
MDAQPDERDLAMNRWAIAGEIGVLAGPVVVAPGAPAKVAAATVLGVLTSGWHPLLKASLYDELPGWSGAATALSSVSGTLAGLLPLGLGLLAGRYGISAAMWAVLAGPAGLLLLLPRRP